MRHDKLQNQLDLLLALTENNRWTLDELGEMLNISRRNMYYYIEFFKQADFDIQKNGQYYSIPRRSKFISRLTDIVQISEDEAIMIKRLLDDADQNNVQVQALRQKLERFYDFHILENDPLRKRQAECARILYKAIKEERMVMIHDYSSPHSKTVSNRLVEPYLLMNNSADLRAYELHSKMNKTFRLSRMGHVEVLEDRWINRNQHRRMYTDLFNFASDNPVKVTLRLDQLSRNVLIEEFPRAEYDITDDADGWLFTTEVCSMIGIGRFVLGLYDHIQIIDSPELKEYIDSKLTQWNAIAAEQK